MPHRSRGFTMIELIVVIVILGILAATALPKFIDLRSDAVTSSVNGVAGNLASAMAVNYAGCSAIGHNSVATGAGQVNAGGLKCAKVSNCTDGESILQGGFAAGSTTFTITSQVLGTGGGGRRHRQQRCHRILCGDGGERRRHRHGQLPGHLCWQLTAHRWMGAHGGMAGQVPAFSVTY